VTLSSYPSLTPSQFELLNDLIPAPKSGGRPREVDMWEILNAIFYILSEDAVGGLCRRLPLGGGRTYFRSWRKRWDLGEDDSHGSG